MTVLSPMLGNAMHDDGQEIPRWVLLDIDGGFIHLREFLDFMYPEETPANPPGWDVVETSCD